MCLATQPRVLLLDEPLAGMGAEETERMLALLAALKRDHAILLVEHDMDAVFRIADRITVMVNGEVIASDAPEAIRANRDVQVAYLGDRSLSAMLDRRPEHLLRRQPRPARRQPRAAGRHARSACSAATAWARRR